MSRTRRTDGEEGSRDELRGTKTRLARKHIAGVNREVIASGHEVVRYIELSRPQMTGHAERVVIRSMDVVGC